MNCAVLFALSTKAIRVCSSFECMRSHSRQQQHKSKNTTDFTCIIMHHNINLAVLLSCVVQRIRIRWATTLFSFNREIDKWIQGARCNNAWFDFKYWERNPNSDRIHNIENKRSASSCWVAVSVVVDVVVSSSLRTFLLALLVRPGDALAY